MDKLKKWQKDLEFLTWATQGDRFYEDKKPLPKLLLVLVVIKDMAIGRLACDEDYSGCYREG